jgi:uncharacterized membrane protein
MIPLADENPTGTRPYVVYVLIVINILVYIVDYLGTQIIRGIPINGLWDYSMVPAAVINQLSRPSKDTLRTLHIYSAAPRA